MEINGVKLFEKKTRSYESWLDIYVAYAIGFVIGCMIFVVFG